MSHPKSLRFSALVGLLLAALQVHCAWAHGGDMDGEGDVHDKHDEQGERGGTQWGIGLGVGVERKPYTGIGDKTEPLPLLFFDNRYLRVFGPEIDAKLPAAGPVSFTLRAKFSQAGYKESDASMLNGMDKRKAGFWLGGTATWRAGSADVSGEFLADVTSPRKGTQFTLAAEHEFETGRFSFTPRVAAIWLDRQYVDYYYGVKSSEARSTRAKYDGRATVNAEIGLRTGYRLAPHQMLFLDLSTTSLGNGIKESPLVDRTTQTELGVGYLYRF